MNFIPKYVVQIGKRKDVNGGIVVDSGISTAYPQMEKISHGLENQRSGIIINTFQGYKIVKMGEKEMIVEISIQNTI